MLPKTSFLRIAQKELGIFFSSPIAFVFLATFLAVNLFVFFWVEAFFARNIADVRPLFEWMPLLLIFLVASLTMRMWSEEKRMGTLEFVFTVPVSNLQFVAGKFLACMTLILLALLLTLPLPLTVSYLGNLDWGPVWGAYLAALCLAGAYTSIGLYVSAKSESQIVSLIMTVLICLGFYILGSDLLTAFVGNQGSEWLKQLGAGSRFESITRGVIDFRDIYYYVSILGVFLTLNIYALEKQRWAQDSQNHHHGLWRSLTGLFIVNFILGNLWLAPVTQLRADLTQGNIYSISDATRSYLSRLKEPLLIRGYFSAKTHPLLAPLMPQIRDLIKEYEVASRGQIKIEFIDPQTNPELEEEANTRYGIKPVPFQVADKYQASLVNSYFNVLIQYGDQFETLSFQDLIEVRQINESELDVKLRNPEYDITRTIKKVLYGYQNTGDLFATIPHDIRFTGYVSDDAKLPPALQTFKNKLTPVLDQFQQESGGKFQYEFKAPEAGDGSLTQTLLEEYGFRPMATSLLSTDTFYFYLTLTGKDGLMQIPLPDDLSDQAFKRNLESTLKRFSTGFTKVVTLVAPAVADPHGGQPFSPQPSFGFLEDVLQQALTIKKDDLSSGVTPADTDLLLVLSPKDLNEKQVFAIDQFLMRGGSVILASAPFSTEMTRESLSAHKHHSGLEDWLAHHGVSFGDGMVLDTQNAPFPIPVRRQVGGFSFQEMRMLDYPYFINIRDEGINRDTSLTAGLPQITFNWASPIQLDEAKTQTLKTTPLLHSSGNAWVSDSENILPDLSSSRLGFDPSGERQAQLLAVALEGRFESFFKSKSSPLLKEAETDEKETEEETEKTQEDTTIESVLDHSTQSARIILFASNEFVTDQTLQLISSAERTLYQNSLQLVQNAVDWSLEDRELLSIRSRGHFTRTLTPLERVDQLFWEYINYAFVVAGLLILFFVYRFVRKARDRRFASLLNLGGV